MCFDWLDLKLTSEGHSLIFFYTFCLLKFFFFEFVEFVEFRFSR